MRRAWRSKPSASGPRPHRGVGCVVCVCVRGCERSLSVVSVATSLAIVTWTHGSRARDHPISSRQSVSQSKVRSSPRLATLLGAVGRRFRSGLSIQAAAPVRAPDVCLPASLVHWAGGSEQENKFSAAALYVLLLSWLWQCGPRMVRTDNRTYGGARDFARNVAGAVAPCVWQKNIRGGTVAGKTRRLEVPPGPSRRRRHMLLTGFSLLVVVVPFLV